MYQGVNLKSGCQQSSGCSWRQALIACQRVHYVRVLISCQGEIHRQGELLKSGCSNSSGCLHLVRVLIFVRVNYSSQGVDIQVKLIRVKFFIRVSKASQGVSAHTLQLDKKPRKLLLETQLLWRNNVVLTRSRCTNV